MTSPEDRLRAALAAEASTVREEDLRPLADPPAVPPAAARRAARGWPRFLAPIAAAAAVMLIVGVAVAIGRSDGAQPAGGVAPGAAPTVRIGGFPTGIAYDGATRTVYVATGETNVLTVVNAATCNASSTAGCAHVGHAVTGGRDPIGVAVDDRTRTAYVVNGGSDTVAVINAATCNAAVTSGCSKRPALIRVPGGPEFLAVDPRTDTIYVAATSSGQVSVINGATCNAAVTSGCAKKPATVSVGVGAFPIAVDPGTDTVYVGTNRDLVLIDGRTCDAAVASGCRKVPATIPVGRYPAGIAVDQAANAIYVSSEAPGTVTVIRRSTCSALDAAGCTARLGTVTVGSDPRGDAADPAVRTVYVANSGSNTVSMISTAACGAASSRGCNHPPAAFPVGASPRRIAVAAAVHTVYIVNVAAGTLSVINSATCNAADSRGCPAKSPRGTGSSGSAGRRALGGMESACAPAVVASASGQPAGPLTLTSVHVASGSVGGRAWSLWSKRGVAGATGIEDGGLVLGGRWYGLCAGFPNVAEMELINAGTRGIDYGFVQFPGKIAVRLASGGKLPSPAVTEVKGMTFFIGQLPRSACSYPAMMLTASGSSGSAAHRLSFGACASGKLVSITGSEGEWGSGSGSASGLAGSGLAGSLAGGGGGALSHAEGQCSPQDTSVLSGRPAGQLTRSSAQVSSGSVGGQAWSLWSRKGLTGVRAVENGGLVFGGRWYGLCPGAPNPAEFELLNGGSHGIVYGFVANPGSYAITLTPGRALAAPQIRRVMGGTFFIGQLAKSACAYPSLVLQATTRSVTDMHHLEFGACSPNKLVAISGGNGSW